MRKKQKTKKDNPLEIKMNLPIYRRHVVVCVGHSVGGIRRLAEESELVLPDSWYAMIEETIRSANGFTVLFGEDNTDVLVWLKKMPTNSGEYGVLYHELYHAVDTIAHCIDDHSLMYDKVGMSEARAYLYEYLVTECNRILWKRNVGKV